MSNDGSSVCTNSRLECMITDKVTEAKHSIFFSLFTLNWNTAREDKQGAGSSIGTFRYS